MIHDFEEIIFMKPWVNRNAPYLKEKYPVIPKKLLAHVSSLSTSAFALIVAEEFILISVITFLAYKNGSYYLWFGIFMGFFIHLIMHIFQWVVFRRYVPTIVTSLLASVYCVYAFREIMSYNMFTISEVISWSVIGLLIVVINVALGHYFAAYFDRWLNNFERGL
jgi:hypothetical protein